MSYSGIAARRAVRRFIYLNMALVGFMVAFVVHIQAQEIQNEAEVDTLRLEAGPELFNTISLVFSGAEDAQTSLVWVEKRGGTDLVAHLITAMRYSTLGRKEIGKTVQKLTGETENKDWFNWMLWQQANPQIKPHPSIIDFKTLMFTGIDSAFQRFFRPGIEFDIRPEEIVWGGVRVDGIPALDNPTHISAKAATYLQDSDEVFGVEINGDVRAYPLRIMGWHEMFNDVIGGEPVSLAYCTLCGAGILFEGNHKDLKKYNVEKPFTFGSSGFLYQSNKLMYDRNTDSLWNQFTGEPVSGKLRGSGIKLKIRPVVITTWGKWKAQHPKTKVLSLNTGVNRNYGSGVVYNEYFASPELMFPALGAGGVDKASRNRTLAEKEQVFGMRLTGGTKAWPIEAFKGGKIINDKVGQQNVVLIGDAATRTVRAYAREGFTFTGSADKLRSSDGKKWQLTEDNLVSGRTKLVRLPGHVAFWFAWAGYLGETSAVYK